MVPRRSGACGRERYADSRDDYPSPNTTTYSTPDRRIVKGDSKAGSVGGMPSVSPVNPNLEFARRTAIAQAPQIHQTSTLLGDGHIERSRAGSAETGARRDHYDPRFQGRAPGGRRTENGGVRMNRPPQPLGSRRRAVRHFPFTSPAVSARRCPWPSQRPVKSTKAPPHHA